MFNDDFNNEDAAMFGGIAGMVEEELPHNIVDADVTHDTEHKYYEFDSNVIELRTFKRSYPDVYKFLVSKTISQRKKWEEERKELEEVQSEIEAIELTEELIKDA